MFDFESKKKPKSSNNKSQKTPLFSKLPSSTSPVQRLADAVPLSNPRDKMLSPTIFHQRAAQGVVGVGKQLPHFDRLQMAFGNHDLSHVKAYTGLQTTSVAKVMGAKAYAMGNKIAFAEPNPDLYTAAHEATHVIQQQAGIQLEGNIGCMNDPYERQADTIANKIVRGQAVDNLLDKFTSSRQINSGASTIKNIKAMPVQMMLFKKSGEEEKDTTEAEYDTSARNDLTEWLNELNKNLKAGKKESAIILHKIYRALNDKIDPTSDEEEAFKKVMSILFSTEQNSSVDTSNTTISELTKRKNDYSTTGESALLSNEFGQKRLKQEQIEVSNLETKSNLEAISEEAIINITQHLDKDEKNRPWGFSGSLAMHQWGKFLGIATRMPNDVDILADSLNPAWSLTDFGYELPNAPGIDTTHTRLHNPDRKFNVDVMNYILNPDYGNLSTYPIYEIKGLPLVSIDLLIEAKEKIFQSLKGPGNENNDELVAEIKKTEEDLKTLAVLKEVFEKRDQSQISKREPSKQKFPLGISEADLDELVNSIGISGKTANEISNKLKSEYSLSIPPEDITEKYGTK